MNNRLILDIPADFLFVHESGFEIQHKIRYNGCVPSIGWINDWLTYDRKLQAFKLRNRPNQLFYAKPGSIVKCNELFQLVCENMIITFKVFG